MKNGLDYFFNNYQLFYQVDHTDIDYGEKTKGNVFIVKRVPESFWKDKLDIDPKDVIWKEWKGVKIPFLFDDNDHAEIITENGGYLTINYDIIASACYFLSGWNEYVNTGKDQYGRVAYDQSIISRLDIIRLPVVNYYFDILHHALLKVRGSIKRNIWGQYNFGVALTHDIDTCRSAWIEGSYSELKKKRFWSIPKLIIKRVAGKDDWSNFELISRIDKQYGDSSSFYFLSQKGGSGGWKNADYDIHNKGIQKEILKLAGAGHEIGVHGSFGTYIDASGLTRDIAAVNVKPIEGNRFHFLMFDACKTVKVLEECEIKYDTSLGFAEQPGFRRGTCFPFFLYDFEEDRTTNIIEIPLIVMDGTLGFSKYMGLTQEKSLETVKPIINEIIKFNGVFTLLWHNTYFSDYKYTGWREVYINILEYCKKNNGLLTSGKGIYEKIRRKEETHIGAGL